MIRTLTLLLALATPAFAQTPAVTVTQPWSRATPNGASTGAVYMTLKSNAPDRLLAVTTPAAKTAAVHEMTMDGNVMRMREMANGLDLPAGKPVTLGPGGYHIMLEGLAHPLARGATVSLHLTFQHAPAMDVEAPIAAVGATAPPH